MSRYKDTCPGCGGEKDAAAKRCRKCYAFQQKEPRSYPPAKGRHPDWPNLPASPELDLSEIDGDWLLAFTGFFMADGYISTSLCNGRNVNAVVTITLRADDAILLLDIASKLGGNVYTRRPKGGHPCAVWNIGGIQRIKAFCELLLSCPLPAKKLRDVALVYEFVQWRMTRPFRMSVEDKQLARSYHERLKRIRAFKEPNG